MAPAVRGDRAHVDAVEERVERLQKRSIKKESKVHALKLALSMIDLTTLEGSDSPGKVRQMCYKAAHLHDTLSGVPKVAAVCVYPTLVRLAKKEVADSGIKLTEAGKFPDDISENAGTYISSGIGDFWAIEREHSKLLDLMETTSREPIDVKVVPDLLQFIALRASLEELDGLPVINMNDVPLQGFRAWIKRILDIVLSLLAMIVLAMGAMVAWMLLVGSLAILGTTVTLTGLLFLLVSSGMSASLALTHVFITVLAVMILANFVRNPS